MAGMQIQFIYLAGAYNGNACYWTGAARTDLPGYSTNESEAFSIYVSGGQIYTAGYYVNNSGNYIPCYWTGTTKTDLPGGISVPYASGVSSIYVLNGNIYTAGYYINNSNNYVSCYWKGTTRTNLVESAFGMANSIVVQ
jgi:hypothetical protein